MTKRTVRSSTRAGRGRIVTTRWTKAAPRRKVKTSRHGGHSVMTLWQDGERYRRRSRRHAHGAARHGLFGSIFGAIRSFWAEPRKRARWF